MKTGFTLIEMLVVVAALGLVMVSTSAVLINAFRAKNKIDYSAVLEQNSDLLSNTLKNNLMNAVGVGISCVTVASEVGNSLSYVNIADGGVTILFCDEANQKIASSSTKGTFPLTNAGVGVSGCRDFVRCESQSGNEGKINKVNFSVYLWAGDQEGSVDKKAKRKFESSVTIRN